MKFNVPIYQQPPAGILKPNKSIKSLSIKQIDLEGLHTNALNLPLNIKPKVQDKLRQPRKPTVIDQIIRLAQQNYQTGAKKPPNHRSLIVTSVGSLQTCQSNENLRQSP